MFEKSTGNYCAQFKRENKECNSFNSYWIFIK